MPRAVSVSKVDVGFVPNSTGYLRKMTISVLINIPTNHFVRCYIGQITEDRFPSKLFCFFFRYIIVGYFFDTI